VVKRHKPDQREFRQYRGLSLEFDSLDANLSAALKQNTSEIAKGLVVKNGEMLVKGCQVVLEALEYQFGKEWIHPPNGFEQKALRWEESASQDGKIDIAANGSAKLEIAKMFRFPNPFFGISYYDGNYGKMHHFIGIYKLRLRIEVRTSDLSSPWSYEPIIYEVYLNYAGARVLEIEEIVRLNAA
jgi:hypothetical protein